MFHKTLASKGILLRYEHLPSLLAGPNVGYANPQHIDSLAMQFSELRIIVAHASYPLVREILGVAFWRPNVFLLPDLYLPKCPWGDEYVQGANEFLEDQVIFGSAYPITSFKEMVEGYKKMSFRSEVLQKVLYTNAAKLLGIKKDVEKKPEAVRQTSEKGKVKYYGGASPFVSLFESKEARKK